MAVDREVLLDTIEVDGRRLVLNETLHAPISHYASIICVDYEPLNILGMSCVGLTVATEKFCREFVEVWDRLRDSNDKDLSPFDQTIKKNLLALVLGEEILDDVTRK